MIKKPFPGRVPADKVLATKKTKDTRKLRYRDSQVLDKHEHVPTPGNAEVCARRGCGWLSGNPIHKPKRAHTNGDVRAVLTTIAFMLEAKRDRLGRLDFSHQDSATAAHYREIMRTFAIKYDVGGCIDSLEQAAKVAREVLHR